MLHIYWRAKKKRLLPQVSSPHQFAQCLTNLGKLQTCPVHQQKCKIWTSLALLRKEYPGNLLHDPLFEGINCTDQYPDIWLIICSAQTWLQLEYCTKSNLAWYVKNIFQLPSVPPTAMDPIIVFLNPVWTCVNFTKRTN